MLGLRNRLALRPMLTLIGGVLILAGCQHEGELQLSDQANTPADKNIVEADPKSEANKEARATPEAASDRFTGPANRSSAVAQKYMVAAANPLAAQAGLEILRAGGSAVDAVIATQLALNVVEPQSSGIGGGAFLMHYQAKSRAIEAFDGRETAPAAASGDMFLKKDGSRPNFHDVVPGGLSVGVPGALRMMESAHKKHGHLSWARLFEPAIKLADEGFKISKRLHTLVKIDRHLKKFSLSNAFFYDNAGFAKPVGTLLVNKPLAETFRQIAKDGADAFYNGDIAADIIKTVRGASLNPGRMTASDLAAYQAKKRSPVCSFYRMWLICGMPPPTSGGITTLQILGLLQSTDLSRLIPGSAEAVHMIAEAGRLAFADRNKYLADDDFVAVPKDRLIDPGYLAKRAKLISKSQSMGKAKPGKVKLKTAQLLGTYAAHEGESTSHISVVDGAGNAASQTSSIENAFGSRLMVRGFLLNNQLTDFSFVPVANGKAIANRVQPKKRPRSSMSPTLVVDGSGKFVMAVGSPGGSRIIGYVAKTLIAALDWKMGVQAAIDLPHFVNRNGTTDLEKGSNLEVLKPALEKLGHKVRIRKLTSGLHAIFKAKDGKLYGGADPRREGVAIGD
tara:strand:+ start:4745 stop:6607 length:1863 start_codon:yes stop_codon:yes gene_type:complete